MLLLLQALCLVLPHCGVFCNSISLAPLTIKIWVHTSNIYPQLVIVSKPRPAANVVCHLYMPIDKDLNASIEIGPLDVLFHLAIQVWGLTSTKGRQTGIQKLHDGQQWKIFRSQQKVGVSGHSMLVFKMQCSIIEQKPPRIFSTSPSPFNVLNKPNALIYRYFSLGTSISGFPSLLGGALVFRTSDCTIWKFIPFLICACMNTSVVAALSTHFRPISTNGHEGHFSSCLHIFLRFHAFSSF